MSLSTAIIEEGMFNKILCIKGDIIKDLPGLIEKGAGLFRQFLGPPQPGRSHHFHGIGNLLGVPDTINTAFDITHRFHYSSPSSPPAGSPSLFSLSTIKISLNSFIICISFSSFPADKSASFLISSGNSG